MKKIKIFQNRYVTYSLLFISGLLIGWLIFDPLQKNEVKQYHQEESAQETIWTCAMHPQIRMPQPGKCPICGMDLIPLSHNGTDMMDPGAVHMTPEAIQLANVHTSVVSKQTPLKEIRLYGKVQVDERLIQSQVAHIPGRIESLAVNFTGESVTPGQVLAEIYSPELITAQQELLETAETKESQPAIYKAAIEKLRQWKLTDEQISGIEGSGKIQSSVDIISNSNGIVTSRRINTGDYVSKGSVLFDVANLSKVWIMFDAYENDLQFLQKGDKITFTLQALPGNEYSGKIAFIDPVIDPVTRIAGVRVEADNRSGRFKPGMFATGIVSSFIEGYDDNPVIPRSSVLWTGKRSVVYVKKNGSDEAVFKMREIELGPSLGERYIVKDGLTEGEEIVTRGTFSVDAAAQLAGKPSMMNPSGSVPSTENVHGNMKKEQDAQEMQQMTGSQSITHDIFEVSGNCEMCKERIENAAHSVKGVSSASWDINTKKIRVEYLKSITSLDSIQKAIADAGHDNARYHASDEVYGKLPECCQYRE